MLLHDIGKPFSYQEGKVRHFKGHASMSSEMAYYILVRLNFDSEEISKICYLIREHDNPINDSEISFNYDLSLLKFRIQCCDVLAHNPVKLEKRINYLIDVYDKFTEKGRCKKLIF